MNEELREMVKAKEKIERDLWQVKEAIMKELIDKQLFHYFSVNWSALRRDK